MMSILLIVALLGIVALAPRFGADSRHLDAGHTDSYPLLPDHEDTQASSYQR